MDNKRGTSACTNKYNGIARRLGVNVIVTSSLDKTQTLQLNAIWDTGATISTINKTVLDKISLPVVQNTISQTANGRASATIHLLDIKLPNNVNFINMPVMAMDLVDTQMLIGMDIISQGDFSVSNYNNHTIISFRSPSFADIDYVQQIRDSTPAINRDKKTKRNDPCPCGSGKKYKNCHMTK